MAAEARRTLPAAGATDVGRQRDVNEDRFHVDTALGVFIVVDGVGGHAAGGRAADTAMAALCERLGRETGPVVDRVREAITIANNEVHRLAATRADWRGMTCVLTVAVVDGSRVVVGHVGDSRLYRLRGDRIEKVTPDHSPVGEREDARELSELDAMRHPRRNEVYRDVGSEPRAVTDTNFAFVAEIDMPADAALLLCSDGLTDLVPSDDVRRIVAAHAGTPSDVVRALIEAANRAGGKDNVTAVYVEGEDAGRQARAARPAPTPLPTVVDTPPSRFWTVMLIAMLAGLGGFLLGLAAIDRADAVASGGVLAPAASAVVVRSGESIAEAIAAAAPGTDVVVEPGVYRERLTLRDHVRVISRVPRGATLREPAVDVAGDPGAALVMATGVTNAELTGFRIVGDAESSLGVGVLTRDASVRLTDLEVVGATSAAFDLGAGDGTMIAGSDVHDNAGSALVLRAGATPRLAHNVLAGTVVAPRTAPTILVEPGARGEWVKNVIRGGSAEAIAKAAGIGGLGAPIDDARAAFVRDNWFPDAMTTPARPSGRGTRGQ